MGAGALHGQGGPSDSLDVGLCYLFGIGVARDEEAAYRCLLEVLDHPNETSVRDQEDARYWLAILHLAGLGGARRSIAKARALLEEADEDGDHEQAQQLLRLIGRSSWSLVR